MDLQSFSPVVSVLANDRRRRICRSMVGRDGSAATLEELARAVGSRARDGRPPPEAPSSTHDRVKVELHHVHLPKLDDAGVVEYSTERRTVEPGDAFPVASELARTASDGERFGSRDCR